MKITVEQLHNDDAGLLFRDIYNHYYEPLCQFAAVLLKEMESAEEIVDDVMFYLYTRRKDVEFTNLRYYLFGLVRNRCFTELHKTKRRHETALSEFTESKIAVLESLMTDESHPLEEYLFNELNLHVDKAIESLPPMAQKVYLMSKRDGLSYEQIANELNISINTVKYHIKAANKQMAAAVGKYLVLFIALQSVL